MGAVSKKLGDIYNSIFTETSPFLAELMKGKMEKKKEFNYIDLKILKEKLSVKKTLMGKAEKEYSESEEDEAWKASMISKC